MRNVEWEDRTKGECREHGPTLVHCCWECFVAFRECLAASQAREKALREALAACVAMIRPHGCSHSIYDPPPCQWCDAIAVLALPTDTSALDAALAKERERCAKVCEARVKREAGYGGQWEGYGSMEGDLTGPECASRIRALGQAVRP